MATAGRILIMPKGAYNESATYGMLDLVKHNHKAWLAKKTCVGIEPSAENVEYWHDMMDLGDERLECSITPSEIATHVDESKVIKVGNLVRVKYAPIVSLTAETTIVIGTIADVNMRPTERLRKNIIPYADAHADAVLYINTDGTITLYTPVEMPEQRVFIDETFIV